VVEETPMQEKSNYKKKDSQHSDQQAQKEHISDRDKAVASLPLLSECKKGKCSCAALINDPDLQKSL
jgi:hypothetical protein